MKIWLPCADATGGLKTFTRLLDRGLREAGHEPEITWFPNRWRYSPARLRRLSVPAGTDVIIANSCHAFALRRDGAKLIACSHHSVFDSAYRPYCSVRQRVFHDLVLRRFEQASFDDADAIVTVSRYTARSLCQTFANVSPVVIHNAVDTEFYCPGPDHANGAPGRAVRLFFVGDLTRRKGADLLPAIMKRLGAGFQLYYTASTRRTVALGTLENMYPLDYLSESELRDQYRKADLLLLPTRFEGFGMAVAEAMSCGTPAVTSACSALPELIQDTHTGRLCPVDDVEAFVATIRILAAEKDKLRAMGIHAREAMESHFNIGRMTTQYLELIQDIL